MTIYMEAGIGDVADLVPWGQVEFSESTGSTTYAVKRVSGSYMWLVPPVKGLECASHGEC